MSVEPRLKLGTRTPIRALQKTLHAFLCNYLVHVICQIIFYFFLSPEIKNNFFVKSSISQKLFSHLKMWAGLFKDSCDNDMLRIINYIFRRSVTVALCVLILSISECNQQNLDLSKVFHINSPCYIYA